MLRALKELEGYSIEATDGTIGKVVNFLFDDDRWVVRYLVVETGGFLDGRRVLISPISLGEIDWPQRSIKVALTVELVRSSPSIDSNLPVSRQHEAAFIEHYGYGQYWGYSGVWGMGPYPQLLMGGNVPPPTPTPSPKGDPNLRSVDAVAGYHVEGNDDSIGHIADFLVDDRSWEIIDLVIDTRNWWFGKHVMVAARFANYIDAVGRKLYVKLSRDAIKACPEWKPEVHPQPVTHA